MATITARRDSDAGYAFFGSGDAYTPPEDVRELLKAAYGQFSSDTKEWRVPLSRSGDLLVAMRAEGHIVLVNEGQSARALHHRPLWCPSCLLAVRSTDRPNQQCPRCSGPLECDGACAATAIVCQYGVDRSTP